MRLFLFLFALGAVTLSDGNPVHDQNGACDTFWSGFNNRCFKYVASLKSWVDAELHCVSLGANLVSIHSEEEQEFVTSLIKSTDPTEAWTWIGLSDNHREGQFMWSDGSAVNFTIWYDRQPDNTAGNEGCVHQYKTTDVKWNDYECSKPMNFVCAYQQNCRRSV